MRVMRQLLALVVPVLVLAACTSVDHEPTGPGDAAAAAMHGRGSGGSGMGGMGGYGTLTPAQAETRFMQDMIDHHLMAVDMGKLCPTRVSHQELRALCANVVTTQGAEIAQVQGWLKSWYGVAKSPTLSTRDADMLRALASKVGSAFEIAWMEEMIPHHHMAIMMAQHLLPLATHSELKAFAQGVVTNQTAEVTLMGGWLASWYGRTAMGGGMVGGRMMGGGHGGMGH